MSIINDALKKTQLSFKKKDKPPAKEAKQEKPEEKSVSNVYEKLYKKQSDLKETANAAKGQPVKKTDAKKPALRSAKKWIKTSAVVAVCLLFLGAGLYFASRLQPVQDLLWSMKKKGLSSRTTFARRAPKRRKYKPGELVLNGTSLIDGRRVALINDEIYQVGEIIDGKTITSINLNKIELKDDEKIITLRVH